MNLFLISKRFLDRYRDRFGIAYLLREYYETFTVYAVPEIVIGPRRSLPFGVHRKKRGLLLRVDNQSGCREMLPMRHEGEGFGFAKVVPDDTFRKRGSTDETLDSVLEAAIEEFVYAAEDFIASTASRLGLTAAANPNHGLGLAA